ncbi:MAG TPA: nucleotidyltransferase family protein [Armatimonadota bacterium]|jgi:hypothetical protein
MSVQIEVDREKIAEFCRKHHIQRLALFGSVLREDFRPDSDVDVLVDFEEGHSVGYITFAGIARELNGLLGRQVDLNTPGGLHKRFRAGVLREAEQLYAA